MIAGLWGKKIGMTQVFVEDKSVPVTVIDISPWVITNQKTKERDGYDAVQVGQLRKRYSHNSFSPLWLKGMKKHFRFVREIKTVTEDNNFSKGKSLSFSNVLNAGDSVDVVGTTKGAGFAGVVRRHGFSGSKASHGAKMGKAPGALSFMRSQGRVIKGKKLPGHMGNKQRMMRNLTVIKVEQDAHIMLVKGSIPGKSGSLVFVRKV